MNAIRSNAIRLAKFLTRNFAVFGSVVISLTGLCAVAVFWSPTPSQEIDELQWFTPLMGWGADPSRFLLQAFDLRQGNGYLDVRTAPCTTLPPGQPVFLSLLMLFSTDLLFLRLGQCLLHVLSGVILFNAMRPYVPKWGFLSGLLVNGSPWAATLASSFMSETFGLFLSCCVVYCVLKMLAGRASNYSMVAMGACTVTACLTCPGVTFTMAAIWCIGAISSWKQPARLGWLILGAVVPMSVWQAHCLHGVGRPALALLHPLKFDPAVDWARVWSRSPDEFVNCVGTFVWPNDSPEYSSIPAYAYASHEERLATEAIAKAWRSAGGSNDPGGKNYAAKSQQFVEMSEKRIAADPLNFYVALPLIRGCRSWIDYRPPGPDSLADLSLIQRLAPDALISDFRQFGAIRFLKRFSRSALSLSVVVLHYLTTLAVAWSVVYALRKRNCTAITIAVTLALYTFSHGYRGPEVRRNLPIIPLALSLIAITKIREPHTIQQLGADAAIPVH